MDLYEQILKPVYGKYTKQARKIILKRMERKISDIVPENKMKIMHRINIYADTRLLSGEFTPEQSVRYQLDNYLKEGVIKNEEQFIELFRLVSGNDDVKTFDDVVLIEKQNLEIFKRFK